MYAICQDTRIIGGPGIWHCDIERELPKEKGPEIRSLFVERKIERRAIKRAPPETYCLQSKPRKITIPHGDLSTFHQKIVNDRNELSE